MATKVRQAVGPVERILLPRLNSIDGELKSINTKIDSVNTRIDSELKSINTNIDAVHTRIDSVHTRIDEMDRRNAIQFKAIENEVRGLSEKVDLIKDVERLKIEVAELKGRQ